MIDPDTLFEAACRAPDYRDAEEGFARWLALADHGNPVPIIENLPESRARRGCAFLDLCMRTGLLPIREASAAIQAAVRRGLHDPRPQDLFAQWGVRERFQLDRIRQRLQEISLETQGLHRSTSCSRLPDIQGPRDR